jgi:20S proteasome alpha/beta subunit
MYASFYLSLNHADGRVLQVEYATAAASHSAAVVVAPVDADTVLLLTTRPARSVQERLVVLSNAHTVVALSGILTDSLALLQKVQDETLSSQRWYGRSLNCQQVTASIQAACQRHAFGGGLRPYGATVTVCGVLNGHVVTSRTDPSGSLQGVQGLQIVGGASNGLLRKDIQRLRQQEKWGPESVSQGIVDMIRRIQEADRKERAAKHDSRKADDEDEAPIIEVVIVSALRGVYKLSPSQIQALLDKASKI